MEIKTILAKTYGILPDTGADLAQNFIALFAALHKETQPVIVEFEKGVFDIYYQKAERELMYITNTMGEDEESVPIHTIAMLLKGLKDVELDFRGATVLMHGAMTNLVIDHCERIKIKNLIIDHLRPYASELTAVSRKAFSAEFRIHKDSKYKIQDGRLLFYGENWQLFADENSRFCWWTPISTQEDVIERTGRHPFRHAYKTEELQPGLIKVRYYLPNCVSEGSTYDIFKVKRIECGIAINRSMDITFENVKQQFNISHALVAQCSKNITLDYVSFAPANNSGRVMASVTDFCHFNCCSGKINISNSFFQGANDDALNVHGVNFYIEKIEESSVTVRFCEHQTYGFNPLDDGDEIVFVDGKSLRDIASSKILTSLTLDAYRIRLVVDNLPSSVKVGDLVEDVSKCADVFYADNYITRLTTRGLLLTTRGKVNIIENTFKNTGMSGILISDDGTSWFESGPVRNVTISGNKFINCKDNGILIAPENKKYDGAVHENILITNNTFQLKKGTKAINARSSRQIGITENQFSGLDEGDELMSFQNCEDIYIKDNDMDKNYVIRK